MGKIKIIVADNSFLIREGLRSIIACHSELKLVGEVDKAEYLAEKIMLYHPDVLIIDYTSLYFCPDDIAVIHKEYPEINILAITNPQNRAVISKAVENGVVSHLLKDCGKDEISEAIFSTAKGQKFFCGKILNTVLKENDAVPTESISCDGIKLSRREIEIIHLVADGLSNKEIAGRLFLSIHTVTTHRKNIMSKLGVNNTAGLVMHALRQNLLGPNKFLFAN